MTTLNDLRQRLDDLYLEPVSEETAVVALSSALTDTSNTLTYDDNILSPDDQSRIAPGRVLELDYEQVRVTSHVPATRIVGIKRGVRNTTAAAHSDDLHFPSRWGRQLQIDTISNAIRSLWQPLFAVKQENATVSTAKYVPLPLNTARIVSVEYRDPDGEWQQVSHKLLPTHPTNPGSAAVQIGNLPYQSTLCVIKYGVKIEVPDSVDDTIDDLPEQWERIILADAASELLSGIDIDAATQEYMTQQLRLERFPVRSGGTISQNLIRYREYLVELAKKDIEAQYPRRIHRRKVSLFS